MRKLIKTIVRLISWAIFLTMAFTLGCNLWVVQSTRGYVHEIEASLPDGQVALVLGTTPFRKGGGENPFFTYRMDAAVRLYKAGKIRHFILSGDNRNKNYNEPKHMKERLMGRGVPESAITLDYAGLRTLDSIVRSKEVFGQDSLLVITQGFHTYRALFICDYYDIEATAYSAQSLSFDKSFKVLLREALARPKAVIDLYFINKQPKFLGKKETIPVN